MHPTVVELEQGNVLIPLQRITQGRHRRLTIAQLQVPQRNDVDIPPHLKKVRRYDALVLAWLVAFSPIHGFSLALPEIRSVGSCEMMAQEAHKRKAEGESGRVRAQHDRWIEPGAGLEFSDTPEVPPPHNLSASLQLRGAARISSLSHFKSGYYGDVLAMATQPDIRGSLPLKSSMYPIFIAQDISADIGLVWTRSLPDLNVRRRHVNRIRKTRRWHLSPDSHCHVHDAPSTQLYIRTLHKAIVEPATSLTRTTTRLVQEECGPRWRASSSTWCCAENVHAWLKHLPRHDPKAT
ncbi:hypothetical protein EDB84DRAFT_1572109 [Lactarius hengduanensis]|nr:hypothetical protein EDB84DRAFT_1572109 [Lactarius hengduanensis]